MKPTTSSRLLKLLILSLNFFCATTLVKAAEPAKRSLTIMPLRKFDAIYGCGCSFYYPPNLEDKGAAVVQWEFGGEGKIRVNNALHTMSVERDEPISTPHVGDPVSF